MVRVRQPHFPLHVRGYPRCVCHPTRHQDSRRGKHYSSRGAWHELWSLAFELTFFIQVFKVPAKGESEADYTARPLYNKSNAFWTARSVADLVAELPETDRAAAQKRVADVKAQYTGLSETYQSSKGSAGIPLA